jgi:hypothetical protein
MCATGEPCETGFYCGADGFCTADCTPDGDQCGPSAVCNADGRCIPSDPLNLDDCPDVTVVLTPVVPNVMLLIDRSGSMDEDFGRIDGIGRVDRWRAVRYGLTDPEAGAVTGLQDRVNFGATLYHSVGGYGPDLDRECPILKRSPGTPPGQPKLGNRDAIDQLMADSYPGENWDTPTAESVKAVTEEMKAWFGVNDPDVRKAPIVLVLATDGNPDNCKKPDAHNLGSQQGVEAEVQATHEAGIITVPLSVGDDVSEDHLARVANAGAGKPLDPPDAPFYKGKNPAELVQAFDTIIRGVRTCTFTLDAEVQDRYADAGTVTLNGRQLEFGVEWKLVDTTTIELMGAACETFLDSDTVNLEGSFPCGRVIN